MFKIYGKFCGYFKHKVRLVMLPKMCECFPRLMSMKPKGQKKEGRGRVYHTHLPGVCHVITRELWTKS